MTDEAACDTLARLPHIRQLLLQLVKHGRAKEVDQLCVGLMHMCTLLPLQAAQQLSAWTLDCCELDDLQAWPSLSLGFQN